MNTTASPRFHWRALTSVLLTLTFLVIAISGVILFLAPPGRVANWTNWNIFGLRKGEWGGLHICFAALFLALTAVHLALNVRPFLSYLRDRVSRRMAARREWIVAAGICLAISVGTLVRVPPFATLLDWGEGLKESWDVATARAPIPHAELLTVAELAEQAGVPLKTVIDRWQTVGVRSVDPAATVQTTAERAGMSAQKLYDIMRASPGTDAPPGAGQKGGGPGAKTLAQFCGDEGLDLAAARARLSAAGIAVEEDKLTLRELAMKSGRKPYDLVALIRGAP